MKQRKKQFVDRPVQGSILVHIVAHWILFLITTAAFLAFVEMLVSGPHDVGKDLVPRYGPFVLAVLALAPIFIYDMGKLTNRFAGPMLRIRRAMKDLAEGREVAPIKFRDRDFWQELAFDFNRVVERLEAAEARLEEQQLQPVGMTAETSEGDNV